MFLLLRKIEIIDKAKPRKLEPVSPINVFAGLKLKGKNPTIAPPSAVINKTAISGEWFSVNIINNDKQEIKVIPDDKPSSPSIKLIALVIPTIHPTVRIYENQSLSQILSSKNGKLTFSIRTPQATTTIAAITCIINLAQLGIPLLSSIKHVIPNITIPMKNPNNLSQYCSEPNKLTVSATFITINK